MDLDRRIELLSSLGYWLKLNDTPWLAAMQRAENANPWFTLDHIRTAVDNIVEYYLQDEELRKWVGNYTLPIHTRTVGIVMAGNIPLVGFHDFLCGFLSGHTLHIKVSSKDEILFTFLLRKLAEWEPEVLEQVHIKERINNCDAYIATGSNNTSRYFEEYFGKYPSIIRKNRTSVAVLDGTETPEELHLLADDIYTYFGLGCRNVTQICVPEGYQFEVLLEALNIKNDYVNLHKYKNNYDYHLAIYLLNKVPYMSNESILMVENTLPFSAVSVLHYRYYTNKTALLKELKESTDVQAIVGHDAMPFGKAQQPALNDYADGVDTFAFLCSL